MTQTTTPTQLRVKTQLQEQREARDLAIYNEYRHLVSNPEQSKGEVIKFLMEKYDLHSNGTVYVILKRVHNRIAQEKSK